MMPQDDIKELEVFISSVQEYIGHVVKNAEEIIPELESFHSLIKDAWDDIQQRFVEIRKYLYSEDVEEQLEKRGLTGVQLELKLTLYRQCEKEFFEAWSNYRAEKSEEEKRKKKGIVGKLLGMLFRITDRILESMNFIPGSHAVREFKGVLEAYLP